MDEANIRMTNGEGAPSDSEVGRWIGKKADKLWRHLSGLIDETYPGVFVPEWLFGGKKHGWSLRYKKSRSFCTFIPEKNRFALLIVFGTEERARVEGMTDGLSQGIRKAYDEATTYHDGKWLFLAVDSKRVVEDVMRLLAVKRKPKKG